MRTRIKICGISRLEDATLACRLGVDALGMIFHPPSPRCISVEAALRIVSETPPFVSRVGVFVNPSIVEVQTVLDRVPLDVLQFHGQEKGAFCESFGKPFIKAIGMTENLDLAGIEQEYSNAKALLLDATTGGSGKSFNWTLWPEKSNFPLILAGGLCAENVAAAIRATRPYAVDVSSGVESAIKSIKDPEKLTAFVSEVSRIHEHTGE